MRARRHAWCVCGLLLCCACGGAQALGQAAAPASASPATEALHAMARLAGVIFTGEVTAVRRPQANDGSTGVVEIDFAVDDAIRGVAGSAYTLREWAGLWAAGAPPFHVGQRYLVLLHAPGAAGLSSPVGGMDGAIPIQAGATPPAPTVDLRWIATRVVQSIAYGSTPTARPAESPASERAIPDTAGTVARSSPQNAPYNSMLALLRDWEKDDAAAR